MSEISVTKGILKNKTDFTLPKGAQIISKDIAVEVEEIENGFLIIKRCEYKYQMPKSSYSDYKSHTEKWYSEDNPLKINTKDKDLADLFENEEKEED